MMKQYVGRDSAINALQNVLEGRHHQAGKKLIVQSVEGPGGIGKTSLLKHALSKVGPGRNYLTMTLNGGDARADRAAFRAIQRLTQTARGETPLSGKVQALFPTVGSVCATVDGITQEATAEANSRKLEAPSALVKALFDLAIAIGKPVNSISPKTKDWVDASALEEHAESAVKAIQGLEALGAEDIGFWERLSFGSGAAQRNAVRNDPSDALAEALVADLSALISGYRSSEIFKPTLSKQQGLDRLLLIVDDYESLTASLGPFFVNHLLPKLRQATFETTVIVMGRDKLLATNPNWRRQLDSVLVPPIKLVPLSRDDTDVLSEANGLTSIDEKDRVWADTKGYPYFVVLWLEEEKHGGKSAVMLKEFYERTTSWMNEQQRCWLDYTVFSHEVNRRTFEKVLGKDQAEDAQNWFENEGSVRDTTALTFRVHDYARSRLIDYMRITDPDRHDRIAKICSMAEGDLSSVALAA